MKKYVEGYRSPDFNDVWFNECGLTAPDYVANYQKMLSSTFTYGGFWISRYEIGDATSTASNTTRTETAGTSGTPVSKINQIPYNYVTCSQAQGLASTMSPDSNKTYSLIFGIQWDLVCKFIDTKAGSNITKADCTSWGNYKSSSLTLNRGKYNTSPSLSISVWKPYTEDTANYVTGCQTSINTSCLQLLTTGASDQTAKMNIYDLAGNAFEWTLEKTSYSGLPCASRGGFYDGEGSRFPASSRSYDVVSSSYNDFAFRATLY